MIRDIGQLTGRTFDVLVVGGGVYGLVIAYDAAQRGLSVALIERDDFGAATSFNHLRTIHGGLRYLQRLDLRRARESARERSALARMAPCAVRPLPFVLPLYGSLRTGKLAMRAGFLLDRLVASGRNRGIAPPLRLPRARVVSRNDAALRFPGLRRRGLTGAAVWYDYVTPESDRLTFSFAIAAFEHGAVLANYVEAISLLVDGKRATGVRARDRNADRELEIAARVVVNATGPAVDRLLTPLGMSTNMPLAKAMNLVTAREAGEEALGGRTRSGRHLFLVPWRGRVVAGTWQSERPVEAHDVEIRSSEVESFIDELNDAFPTLELTPADVTLVHRGVVPGLRTPDGRVQLAAHERLEDHSKDGFEGIVSVAGTKYTTARAVAERVVDRIGRKLQRTLPPCRTASTLLPGGSARDIALTVAEARQDHDRSLPSDAIPHLVAAYGSRYRDILALAPNRQHLLTPVSDESPVIGAELAWAARKEMVVTLSDAVIRRTPLGALGCPGDLALERAAAIVGAELNWQGDRRRGEIAAVQRFYALPRPSQAGT
jgi:glycerol-3-phosphate dehydrogenase